MRALGDVYMRDEFKRHHFPDMEKFTEDHYRTFLAAWRNYIVELTVARPGSNFGGRNLKFSEVR